MKNKVILIAFLLVNLFCPVDSSAQLGWQWGMGSVHSFDVPTAMVNDRSGNIFVACQLAGDSVLIGSHILYNPGKFALCSVIKTDSSGNYLWSVVSKNSYSFPISSVTDPAGNLYVLGTYYPHLSTTDSSAFYIDTFTLKCDTTGMMYFLLKISPAGSVLWAKNVAITNQAFGGIGVDKNSNVYITGDFIKPIASIGSTTLINTDASGKSTDVFLAKYDSLGNPLWAKSLTGIGGDYPYAITVAKNGNIYMAGVTSSINITIGSYALGNTLHFLAKFNNGGNCVWAEKINDISTNSNAMVLDASENIYMTGALNSSTRIGADSLSDEGSEDMFIAKYDSLGNAQWANSAGGTNSDQGFSIAVDQCLNVWVCGQMGYDGFDNPYTMNFNGYTLTKPLGSFDPMFIAEYDHDGKFLTSMALNNGGYEYGGIIVDNSGNFYVCGGTDGLVTTMKFGDSVLSFVDTTAREDLFIAKFKYKYDTAPCPSYLTIKNPPAPSQGITIYPNPAANECTIQNNGIFLPGSKADLIDLTGRLINTYPLSGSSSVISMMGIAPGMYQCRITTTGGVVVKKLVVMK